MLQNAYLVAKIGADTAENERHLPKICQKIGNYPILRQEGCREEASSPTAVFAPFQSNLVADEDLKPGMIRQLLQAGDGTADSTLRFQKAAPLAHDNGVPNFFHPLHVDAWCCVTQTRGPE